MNAQHILERALLKAHKGGWEPLITLDWKNVEITQWQGKGMVGIALLYNEGKSAVTWVRELEGIIYNQDFAKALWGDEPHPFSLGQAIDRSLELNGAKVSLPVNWAYHLQAMVVAKDPIKYLGENI